MSDILLKPVVCTNFMFIEVSHFGAQNSRRLNCFIYLHIFVIISVPSVCLKHSIDSRKSVYSSCVGPDMSGASNRYLVRVRVIALRSPILISVVLLSAKKSYVVSLSLPVWKLALASIILQLCMGRNIASVL